MKKFDARFFEGGDWTTPLRGRMLNQTKTGVAATPVCFCRFQEPWSPNQASIFSDHRLFAFAAKCLGKLRHV